MSSALLFFFKSSRSWCLWLAAGPLVLAVCLDHVAVVAVCLLQGGAGVREGRHLQAGQAPPGRLKARRDVLHSSDYYLDEVDVIPA